MFVQVLHKFFFFYLTLFTAARSRVGLANMARQRSLTVASAGTIICSSVSETSSIISPAHTSHSLLSQSTPVSFTAPQTRPAPSSGTNQQINDARLNTASEYHFTTFILLKKKAMYCNICLWTSSGGHFPTVLTLHFWLDTVDMVNAYTSCESFIFSLNKTELNEHKLKTFFFDNDLKGFPVEAHSFILKKMLQGFIYFYFNFILIINFWKSTMCDIMCSLQGTHQYR